MARSDLLVSLVKAGTSGDTRGFRSTAEAIIAEERAKRHDVQRQHGRHGGPRGSIPWWRCGMNSWARCQRGE